MCAEPGDYEEWRMCTTRAPRARRDHRCYECGHIIPRGERHTYRFVVGHDGDAETYRTHLACEELRDFIENVVCGGHGQVLIGGLDEEISEAGQYIDADHDAWEEAGLEVPNPLREVFDFIQASYPIGPLEARP